MTVGFVKVPQFLWSSTPLLKELDLSYNPVRTVQRDHLVGLWRLQTLTLQPLPVLETIDGDALQPLTYLTRLAVQTWPGPTLAQLVHGLRGLRHLDVDVRGTILSPGQFRDVAGLDGAPKLRHLDVSGAQLRVVQADAFAHAAIGNLPECSLAIRVRLSFVFCFFYGFGFPFGCFWSFSVIAFLMTGLESSP